MGVSRVSPSSPAPVGSGRDPLGTDVQGFAQAGDDLAQDPRHLHLADSEPFGDLVLGALLDEAPVEDRLLTLAQPRDGPLQAHPDRKHLDLVVQHPEMAGKVIRALTDPDVQGQRGVGGAQVAALSQRPLVDLERFEQFAVAGCGLALLDSLLPLWHDALVKEPERCVFARREARIDRVGGRPRWLSVSASVIEIHSDDEENCFNIVQQRGLLLAISDVSSLREEQERSRAAVMQAVLADEERTSAIREGLSAAIFRLEEPMNVMASAVSVLYRRDPLSAEALDRALAASREHLELLRQVIPHHAQEIEVHTNLNEVLRDVLEISTQRLLGAGIVVDWNPAITLPPIIGRPLQLCMLFKALVDNAIEAMNIKGWSRRELSISSAVQRECIVITVSDSGPGIPPDSRHKAFEPFFSAKPASGPHIGTGLSRAQQVVADHGGIIDLEESSSGGCLVIVEFRLDGDPI